jgi:hypothetical protein
MNHRNISPSLLVLVLLGIIMPGHNSSLSYAKTITTKVTSSAAAATITTAIDTRKLQIPDITGDLPSWAQNWWADAVSGIDWSSDTAWQDWLGSLWAEGGGSGGEVLKNVCPILEAVVGMGQSFGVAGKCDCEGDVTTNVEIACSFEECVALGSGVSDGVDDGSNIALAEQKAAETICGSVAMNVTFGGAKGAVTTSVCADFPNSGFQETCFSYDLSMADGKLSQSCQATYGGADCLCLIEDFCLTVNCSSVLPGAAMDTCQMLSMLDGADLASWVPKFEIFDSNFVLGKSNVLILCWCSLLVFVHCPKQDLIMLNGQPTLVVAASFARC